MKDKKLCETMGLIIMAACLIGMLATVYFAYKLYGP